MKTLTLIGISSLLLASMPSHATAKNTAPSTPELQRSLLLSVGQSRQSSGDIAGQLQNLGYTAISVNNDRQASSWSLGYRHPVNLVWSLDMEYQEQGKTNPQTQATLPFGRTEAQAAKDAAEALPKRGKGLSILGVYHYPLMANGLTLQTGIGAFVWESERTATVGGSRHTAKSEGLSPLLHLGLSYPVTKRVRLEGRWQHAMMPDEPVDNISLGIAVGF